MTVRTLLLLTSAPVVGKAYHLRPIIGDGLIERTAVYRGVVKRVEDIRFYNERTGEKVFRYVHHLGQFADIETGEIFAMTVESSDPADMRNFLAPTAVRE